MTTRADTESKLDGPTGASRPTSITTESGRTAAIGGAVSDAAATARDVVADAAGRLPDAAASARSAIEDANRQMRGGSDEMLAVGSALSLGLAGGLLIAGAPRLIVTAALVPAVMLVLTLFDRTSRAPGTAGRLLQGR